MTISVKYIRSKLPLKNIPRIIVEPTYKAINKLMEALYENSATIPTALRRRRNGHIGLLTDAAVYANVATTAFAWPTDTAPLHNIGQATQQRHNPKKMKSKRRAG